MTNVWSKRVALFIVLKNNKKDSADVYCITSIELPAHRDALIQKNYVQLCLILPTSDNKCGKYG